MIFLLCFGGAPNCAKHGKQIITPRKNRFRVKRGKRKLFVLRVYII